MYNQGRDCRNGEKGETTVNDAEEGDQRTPCSVVTIRNSKDYLNVRNFDDLPLYEDLLRGLHASGYETPPPVLQKALIPVMKGYDVIINSWPEANERLLCSVLALQRINTSVQQCQVLILARSAQQAGKTQQAIANLERFMNVCCHASNNGKKLREDSKVAAGAHIVVGTPNRLYDMIKRNHLLTAGVKLFVLHDADRMLFKKVRDKIYNILETVESKAQVLLLTSFLEEPVFEKCRTLLRDPYFIVTSKAEPIPGIIRQVYVPIRNNSQKREILYNFYRESGMTRTIIFCNKTKQAKILENKMREAGITASALHGGKTRKEKKKIIEDFYSLSNSILITTDAFVDELPQRVAIIINFNSPNKRNYYDRMCKADPSCKGVIINFSTLQENGIIEKFYKTEITLIAPLYGIGSLGSCKWNDECYVVQGEEHENSEKSDTNFPGQIPVRNIKHFYIPVEREKLKWNVLHTLYTDLNIQRAVIFCNARQTVRDLEEEMMEKSYPVLSLHRKTPAKKRQLILEEFHSIYDRTLITNDSLKNSRVQEVPIIIYYDYYRHKKLNYASRIRTDQWFSPQGIIINFVKESVQKYLHEMEYFHESKIQRLLGYDVSTVKNYNLEYKRDTTPSESNSNLLQNLDTNPDSIIEFGSKFIADSFEDMDLSCELLQTISDYGLAKPTAFQQKVITSCLHGHNVIIHAQPNKGRKIALAIAALQRVDLDVKSCQQLILASTTDQIMKIQKVISALKGPVEAYCERCVMGSSDTDCVNHCKVVAQIAMGTPKFAEDKIRDRNFTADKIKMFILYEAEKLLSEEYREELFRLYGMLNRDVQIILLTSNITTDVWESPIFMRDFIYITP